MPLSHLSSHSLLTFSGILFPGLPFPPSLEEEQATSRVPGHIPSFTSMSYSNAHGPDPPHPATHLQLPWRLTNSPSTCRTDLGSNMSASKDLNRASSFSIAMADGVRGMWKGRRLVSESVAASLRTPYAPVAMAPASHFTLLSTSFTPNRPRVLYYSSLPRAQSEKFTTILSSKYKNILKGLN